VRRVILILILMAACVGRANAQQPGQGCTTVGATATWAAGGSLTCIQTSDGTLHWSIGGGGGGGSIGAAVNVKANGAVGNGKFFVDGVTNGSNNQLTSATATFAASDVGQAVTCISLPLQVGATKAINNASIVSFVNSSTLTYSGANVGGITGMFCSLTSPSDPAAILAAFNSCKTTFNAPQAGTTYQAPACSIYLPTGIYGFSNVLENLIATGNEDCVGIIGDGMGKTVLIPTGNFVRGTHDGVLINDRCGHPYLKDFTIEVGSVPFDGASSSGFIATNGTQAFLENVAVQSNCVTGATLYGIADLGGTNQAFIRPTVVTGGACGGVQGGLIINGASEVNVYSPFLSNSQQNLEIVNAQSGANGSAVVVYGGVIDEGSITKVISSIDVWFVGTTLTGGANCLSVDATSIVNYFGGYCGTFGGNTGGGITVSSGGKALITGLHVNAVNGGSACYTSAAFGGIVDDGTNRCTTSGGGTAYPSGGIINQLSLSHAQANAFQSGTLAAGTVQTFYVDQPIAVSSITWTPSNAFACTAGSFPTFSITDGSVTLTTSVSDTTSNGSVNHVFANTTASILNASGAASQQIQIKVVTIGTCGTAPTNTNINAFWQATAPVL